MLGFSFFRRSRFPRARKSIPLQSRFQIVRHPHGKLVHRDGTVVCAPQLYRATGAACGSGAAHLRIVGKRRHGHQSAKSQPLEPGARQSAIHRVRGVWRHAALCASPPMLISMSTSSFLWSERAAASASPPTSRNRPNPRREKAPRSSRLCWSAGGRSCAIRRPANSK